jgi:hypothetical protein
MAHKTIGTTYKTTGNDDTNRLIFDKGAIKGIDENENTNLFFGYDPDISSRPVLRISKDGEDAMTGENSDLIFNSDQNVFKIVAIGNTSIDATNASAGVPIINTIPHGFAFIPIPMAFAFVSGAYFPLPTTFGPPSTGSWMTLKVDSTNLYVNFFPVATTNYGILDFKYYLLQETVN